MHMNYLTYETVTLATCAGFIVGFVWYSPILFMNAWLYGQGITKETMPKRSKAYMIQINLYSIIAHGAIASVVALMFDVLQVSTLKVAVTLGMLLTFGFIVTTHYIDMLYTVDGTHWNKRAQIKFLVHAGYYLCAVSVMSAVLFLVA